MTATPPAPPRTFDKRRVAGMPVTEWPGDGPVVFGIAGLGSHAPTWAPVADAIPNHRVLSIDLRGRGDGQGMTGPTGLRAHAEDVAAVLAELDLTDIVLAGHSMGAFLAPVVAQQAPGRIRKLVLVDGGIRPKLPFFLGRRLTALGFRRQLTATDRAWSSVAELAAHGRSREMLDQQPELTETLLSVMAAELGGEPGALRPRIDVDRAVADAVDAFHGPDTAQALDALTVPAEVFLAENQARAGQPPFISDKAVEPWLTRQPLLRVRRLPGNHVTVLYSPEVAAAVSG